MAFKPVLDTLDGLSEDVAKEYVEKDGKFHIQVEGMKTQADVDKVQASLTAARTEVKTLKDRIGLLGEHKIEDVLVQLDRIPELEAAAKGGIDEAKMNELVEGRIKTRLAPIERERDTLRTAVADKDKLISTFTAKERTRVIRDEVRTAAKASSMLDEAVDDAMLLGDLALDLTEEGAVVVKTGQTGEGLSVKDWLADLQTKKTHWWGPSAGGGARGGGGGAGGANPFTHENWNMTEQGKILTENRARAEALAKAAGTTIGGARPAPKK